MFKTIKFIGELHEIDLLNDARLTMTSITGISGEAAINTSSTPGYAGSTFVSSSAIEKNIDLIITFKPDANTTDKQRIMSTFLVESNGELRYITDDSIKILRCIVKKCDIPLMNFPMTATISMVATCPFFTDINSKTKIMSAVTPLFKFPFTFNGPFKFGERMASVIENFVNDSTVDVYPIIEFKAISALTNPSIMNINTYEKMKVNVSLSAGEKLRIDTRIGKKSITKISGSEETNVFNSMSDDFKFFKLYTGDNYLKYDADTNSAGLQTTVIWENLYGGV